MTNTKAGAQKAMQTKRDRYGVDEQGRSLKQIEVARLGGKASAAARRRRGDVEHFAALKLTNPEGLAEISSRGGKSSRKKQQPKDGKRG